MARDVLVVPILTVTFESPFSTGGGWVAAYTRSIFNGRNSSICPKLMQVSIPFNLRKSMDHIEYLEEACELGYAFNCALLLVHYKDYGEEY